MNEWLVKKEGEREYCVVKNNYFFFNVETLVRGLVNNKIFFY